MLLAATWKIPLALRSDTATFFASKDLEYLQKEDPGKECEFLGRWHNAGNGTGVVVLEAKDSEAVAKFLWSWAEDCCDVECAPVLKDDEAREIILKRKPDFKSPILGENMNTPIEEGETLFWLKWTFFADKKIDTFNNWAKMTEEEETASHGNCRFLGRFCDLAQGTGFAIVAAKSAFDIQQMLYPWLDACEVDVTPVVPDATVQHVIQAKEGYQIKSDSLKKKMEEMKI